ncbi:hypothetical protein [Actinoplanes regularis]|nr:hypothetical protein [Actinoplanes regularis]
MIDGVALSDVGLGIGVRFTPGTFRLDATPLRFLPVAGHIL